MSNTMRPLLPLLLLVSLCVGQASNLSAEDKVLHIAADSWMPYNGDPEAKKPGYVVEMVRSIFEKQGYKVAYSTMPYTEALAAVREGKLDAVIGPDEVEAKDLRMPAEPMCEPKICLLTRASNKWNYDNINSLKSQKLGATEGYSYWPALDGYIKANPNKVLLASGDSPIDELFAKLESGEIDILVETEPVLLWHLREHKLDRNQFRAVLRQDSTPCYVAFAPTESGRVQADIFDKGVRELRGSGALAALLKSYGLNDWK